MKGLAELLGVESTQISSTVDVSPLEAITDPREFALAVLSSREFRQYIVCGLSLGNLPGFTSILGRLMDYAWGKSPDRVEHTGKDGDPIITEVRRVIVRMKYDEVDRLIEEEVDRQEKKPTTTH